MRLLNKFLSALSVPDPVLTPVPPAHYYPNSQFAMSLRASLSDGSVSMGAGRMVTQEDHDQLYARLKGYRFVE